MCMSVQLKALTLGALKMQVKVRGTQTPHQDFLTSHQVTEAEEELRVSL